MSEAPSPKCAAVFSFPPPCSVCRAAAAWQDFALCLAKWGSAAAFRLGATKRSDLKGGLPSSWACVVFQLNVIFLGIALYKMFHHTAILKPDSGCLDNIK